VQLLQASVGKEPSNCPRSYVAVHHRDIDVPHQRLLRAAQSIDLDVQVSDVLLPGLPQRWWNVWITNHRPFCPEHLVYDRELTMSGHSKGNGEADVVHMLHH
jgi:hypothetical protein